MVFDMENEIYKSSKRGKIRFYALVMLAILILLVVDSSWFSSLFMVDISNIKPEELALRAIEKAYNAVLYNSIALILYFILSYLVFSFGLRTKRSGQFPPPNSEIPFSMKIKRGRKAIIQAYALYACATLILVNGLFKLWGSLYLAEKVKEAIGG